MVRSLGFRTDLALLEAGGSTITEGPGCLVVTTPANPHFWWGNFLLLPTPPAAEDVDGWLALARRSFPQAQHVAIGVDGTDRTAEDLAPLRDRGFDVIASSVLIAAGLHPPARIDPDAVLRPLASSADWAASVELGMRVDAGEPVFTEHHREYVTASVATNRQRSQTGRARWFGAFAEGELVAELGLADAGGGLARFQKVQTDPRFRRRGLAGALLHEAARWGVEHLGASTLVIVADPDYHAITLYERAGFIHAETQLQAELRPR